MMLPQRTTKHGAGSFRPALEVLEDRLVLSNSSYVGTLSQLSAATQANANQVDNLTDQFNKDLATFANNPQSVDALLSLISDSQKLESVSIVLQQQASLFSGAVTAGELFGLVTGSDAATFDNQKNTYSSQSFQASLQAVHSAQLTLVAFQDFFNNAPTGLQPLPTTQPTTTQPAPTGTFSENITPPPATWPSDALTPPPCSVTVTNPTNTPLTVTVSYTDTLGNKTSSSDVCTNSTITVADGGAVCPPGNTGTFTVSVTGQPDQHFTVTFQ
jgi:hypothetical protein